MWPKAATPQIPFEPSFVLYTQIGEPCQLLNYRSQVTDWTPKHLTLDPEFLWVQLIQNKAKPVCYIQWLGVKLGRQRQCWGLRSASLCFPVPSPSLAASERRVSVLASAKVTPASRDGKVGSKLLGLSLSLRRPCGRTLTFYLLFSP